MLILLFSDTFELGTLLDFDLKFLSLFSNAQMPDVIVDYDMSRQKYSIVQQEEVKGVSGNRTRLPAYEADTFCLQNEKENVLDFESERWKDFSSVYCCERKEVVSYDGVRIPLTILYAQKSWQKGQSHGVLHGYGAYGEVLEKSWCSNRLSLLDRGWVVAFADVRLVPHITLISIFFDHCGTDF